jgi:hypothetical protein
VALCHGNPTEHCCWVDGQRCPNLLEGPQVLAAVEALIVQYDFKGQANNAAKLLDDGITFACHVALKVLAAHLNATSQLADRATFEAAWTAHPDYQPIADAWEAIGKPRSWCPEYGPAEGQCCFAENATTNATKAAGIPVSVRNLRNAIGSV